MSHPQGHVHTAGDFPHTLTPRDPGHLPLKVGALLFAGVLTSLSAVFAIVEYSGRGLKDALLRIETHFDGRLDRLETQFDNRLGRLETKFDQRFDRLEAQVHALDRKVDRLEVRLDKVEAFIAPKTGQPADTRAQTR